MSTDLPQLLVVTLQDVDVSELFAALSSWGTHPERLLDVPESQEIEFKTAPYLLANDRDKLEFAKDVAAMANGGGGVIVIGIKTERDPNIGQDVSKEIRPVAPGSVNAEAMRAVARDWIYPPSRSIEIRDWTDGPGQLLVSIRVPPFHESPGLALVRAAELGTGVERRMFSVPVRGGGSVDFHTPGEVYEWIRRGRLVLLSGRPEPAEEAGAADQAAQVQAQLDRARTILGNEDWPTFLLQAWTTTPALVERMHDTDGVRGLFTEPPSLRSSGFNFRWWGPGGPEVDVGGGLRVPGRNRGTFWLTPTGILTVAATAGPDLLGWAMERYSQRPTINPLTLVELTLEFCRLYLDGIARFLRPASPFSLRTLFRVGLLDAQRPEPIRLPKGRPRFALDEQSNPAPEEEMVETVGEPEGFVVAEPPDSPVVAEQMLQRLYGRFGIGTEGIPFLTQDRTAVDVEAILRA